MTFKETGQNSEQKGTICWMTMGWNHGKMNEGLSDCAPRTMPRPKITNSGISHSRSSLSKFLQRRWRRAVRDPTTDERRENKRTSVFTVCLAWIRWKPMVNDQSPPLVWSINKLLILIVGIVLRNNTWFFIPCTGCYLTDSQSMCKSVFKF